ncbi:outer membrane beta-barrel protein [Viscerimonas tarda]
MKYKYTSFVLLFFISLCAFSQQAAVPRYTIEGEVVDSLLSEKVEMATIALYSQKDSSFVKGTGSDANGRFTINNVNPATYYLTISFLGYKTVSIPISEKRFSSPRIKLGKINLPTSNIELSSVVVTAELAEMVVKEDTIEYNAAAFRLTESAVVEDLLKRLPGVDVDTDGKITTSTGKDIRRVFVDGKEFFGNDPKMATRNLTANMVDKVQVVEKKSDLAILTGVEDDDPETIINITIKKGMKKGWMGNITGGAGGLIDNVTNESARYTASGNVYRFTEDDQLAFVTNANNINQQASTDGGNAVRAGRGGGAGGNGITSSNAFGVNTNKIINDKLKYGASISYNYRDNYVNNTSVRQNFQAKNVNNSSSYNRDYSNNVVFNGRLEYRLDSATTMIFTPSFSYNSSLSKLQSNQTTVRDDADLSLINSSNSVGDEKSDGLQLRMQFDVSHKLSAAGRRVSFSGWFSIDNNSGNGSTNAENIFYNDHTKDQIRDQRFHTTANRDNYNLRLTYVEPLGKGNFLNFSYNIQNNNTKNRKTTLDYDEAEEEYSILSANYSKSSDTRSVTQNIRANFNSNKTKYAYNVGLSISPVYNDSKNFIEDWFGAGQDSIVSDPDGRFSINYAPFFDFTYRFGGANRFIRKNLRLRYNGQMRQPSITQLDPSQTSTNPLRIRSGNPDLLPSFNNSFSLEFNTNNRETQRSLTATLSYTFVQNQIINYTSTDTITDIQYTSPINENGSWNSAASVLASIPLDDKKKFKLSSSSRARYNNEIGYSNLSKEQSSVRNVSKTLDLSEIVKISYSNDWYYGQLSASVRYANTSYSLATVQDRKSYNYGLTYYTQLTLPLSFSIASDIAYTANRGLSDGYNKSELLWNAELSKQFLKQNRGSLRFQITDILQQRLNIRRTQDEKSITDSKFTALSSYAIISFAYRFNNVGGRRTRGQNRGNTGDSFENTGDTGGTGDYERSGDRPMGGNRSGGGRRGN